MPDFSCSQSTKTVAVIPVEEHNILKKEVSEKNLKEQKAKPVASNQVSNHII